MSLLDLLNKPTQQTKTIQKTSGLSALLDKVVQEPKKSVTDKGAMIFRVGEGMNEEQTKKAKEAFSKPVIPVGQEIKVPFVQKGITVPSGDGVGAGYSAFKMLIEFPEKATRTLTTDFGKSRQTEEKQWRVPSYSEVAGKETGQLIDEGMPPTAAVILSSTKVGGEFANDALIFDFVLGSAVRNLAKKVAVEEGQSIAYDFLGRPKTLAQAEANFKNIQKQFHPDITGTDKVSKQANNAITILRKNGIPNQSALKIGLDKVLNRPVSKLFKPEVPTTTPTAPILSLAEKYPKPPAPKQVEAITTPKTTPETQIVKTTPEIQPKEVVKVPSEQLPVKTEGETKVSRLEARMKEKLDLVKPEEAKEQGLSTFEQMNKKEQMVKASEYVLENPDEALEVLKGNKTAPKDLLHNSIALALETQAEITGNAELISKLASLRSTRFGQEISILTEADPLNITTQVKNIQIARENATMKKLGKKISKVRQETDEVIGKVIKEERTLAQVKVAEAEKLLESIMC